MLDRLFDGMWVCVAFLIRSGVMAKTDYRIFCVAEENMHRELRGQKPLSLG